MTGRLDAFTRRPALLGALLALVVGAATYVYVQGASAAVPSATVAARAFVVVVERELAPGDRVDAADLTTRELPVDAILPGSLADPTAAIGRFALRTISPGEQLNIDVLGSAAPGGALARLVPAGARAMAIAISHAIAAGGLVQPGDRVDVVAVFDELRAGRSGSALIVDNVEVLAVSAVLVGAPPAAAAERASTLASPTQFTSTVTLAVTPEEAQRLAVAEEFGALRLVVRSVGDSTRSTTPRIDLEVVTAGAR